MKLNDRANLALIRQRFDAHNASLAKELGVVFKLGACSYMPNGENCNFKLEVADTSSGTVVTREETDFKRYASLEGMQESDLGRKFNFQGETWTLIGYKPKSYVFPFLAKNSAGGVKKFPGDTIRRCLGIPHHIQVSASPSRER